MRHDIAIGVFNSIKDNVKKFYRPAIKQSVYDFTSSKDNINYIVFRNEVSREASLERRGKKFIVTILASKSKKTFLTGVDIIAFLQWQGIMESNNPTNKENK